MTSRGKLGLSVLVVALIAVGSVLFFQSRTDVPVIGILHPTKVHNAAVAGFKKALQEYGYEEGNTVTYLYAGPAGSRKRLTERAQEIVASGANIIYTASTPATKAALKAVQGRDIVVVFGPVNDPVGANIVESLRRPGRAVTGVTLAPSTAKRLAWFREFSPAVERILVPFNPDDRSSTSSLRRIEAGAKSLGFDLQTRKVRNPDEVRALFRALPKDIDGIFLPRDSMINAAIGDIAPAAIARKLPLSGPGYNQVIRGALYGYGVRQGAVGRTAARLVREVLSGTDPAVIPVETVDSHLYINSDTARAIGLMLSPALLAQAKAILP